MNFFVWELRPTALDDLGLKSAVEHYVRRWSEQFQIPAAFHGQGFDDTGLKGDVATNLYRIAREALNNTAKHGRASKASVVIERRRNKVVMIVEDDGRGFNAETQHRSGLGLKGMYERAEMAGGTLEIESKLGSGTTIYVTVPLGSIATAAANGKQNAKMESKIRVLIAEDHAVVRAAVRALLDNEPDIEVVGEAGDGETAVSLAKTLAPDVVLMDISMPKLDGARATRRVKNVLPNTKVLVLTRHDEDGYLKKLLAEGADGYVLKQSASAVLIDAVRQVSRGNFFLDPTLTLSVVTEMAGRSSGRNKALPTNREKSVLRLTALGYSIKEIAVHLDVSPKTVESARSNAVRKLELSGRVDIVHYAIGQGWMKDN